MMRCCGFPLRHSIAALALLWATGCASPPAVRYYTLVAPAGAAAAAAGAAPLPFELLPVGVPAQVDQEPLVVRGAGSEALLPLENERWIAPLADELRSAVSARIAEAIGAVDVTDLPRPPGATVLRIKIDVRRFDAVMASHTDLEASWSLRPLTTREEPVAALCASRIREMVQPAESTAAALVRSHQRAVARMATQIAEAAARWTQRRGDICPDPAVANASR
jgi:uncharacterized protein